MAVTGCRFAVSGDDTSTYRFCNATRVFGRSYCQEHLDLCYRKAGDVEPFYASQSHSNIAKAPKAAAAPKAPKVVKPRPKRDTKPMYHADSLRGRIYDLILNTPMSMQDISDRTNLSLKVVKETVADLHYCKTNKGRFQVHRQGRNGLVYITVTPDVKAMIG